MLAMTAVTNTSIYDMEYVNNYAMSLYTLLTLLALAWWLIDLDRNEVVKIFYNIAENQ